MEPLRIKPRNKKPKFEKVQSIAAKTINRIKCRYRDGTFSDIKTSGLENIILDNRVYIRLVGKNKYRVTVDPMIHCEIKNIQDVHTSEYGIEIKI